MIDPTGVYAFDDMPVAVERATDGWRLRFGGVPAAYEPRLAWIADSVFRIEGGTFDGVDVQFTQDTAHMGPMRWQRVDGPYEDPPGYGLRPPIREPDPQRDDAFRSVIDTASGSIDWTLPYPKHVFVGWLTALDRFIFHSSIKTDIAEFSPRRDSMDLADTTGRGNITGIYGTHDGYWSMFFGILDRDKLRGTMRNGVFEWETPDGRRLKTYQFSLEQESLRRRPFRDGAFYILPREPFRRLDYYPGGPPSDEWVAEIPVEPVAVLPISPEDFPFLDTIAGHDESDYFEMLSLASEMFQSARSVVSGTDRVAIEIEWSRALDLVHEEWVGYADDLMPAVGHNLIGSGPRRKLVLEGPEAYVRMVSTRVQEILNNRT